MGAERPELPLIVSLSAFAVVVAAGGWLAEGGIDNEREAIQHHLRGSALALQHPAQREDALRRRNASLFGLKGNSDMNSNDPATPGTSQGDLTRSQKARPDTSSSSGRLSRSEADSLRKEFREDSIRFLKKRGKLHLHTGLNPNMTWVSAGPYSGSKTDER